MGHDLQHFQIRKMKELRNISDRRTVPVFLVSYEVGGGANLVNKAQQPARLLAVLIARAMFVLNADTKKKPESDKNQTTTLVTY